MTLKQILTKHFEPAGLAGGKSSAALERDLARHARANAVAYIALFVLMLLILLGVGAMMVMDVRDGRGVRTGVLASAGVTFPVILELIRRTVREWSRTDLMAVLCRRLDGGQIQLVIDKLLAG